MPTVGWALLTALAFAMLRAMPHISYPTAKAVLVRLAAVLFLVAGTITAGGVIGAFLHGVVNATGQFGAGLAWIIWFVLALMWIATMLPGMFFSKDMPDWLSMSGLALPTLLASVPGSVGAGIGSAMVTAHDTIGVTIASWFQVSA